MMRLVSFISVLLLGLASVCRAQDVTLQWDPNTEPDIAGYKIYYRTDSSELPFIGIDAAEGSSPVDVKNVTTATLTGLDPSKAHYFAVTAYDVDGYESSFSNIVTSSEALPPVVAIESPAPGATLSGVVAVSGTATDNVQVAKIEVFLDGQSVATPASSPYNVSVDVSAVSNGSHTIKVVATDTAGNVGETAASYNVLNDYENPAVTCTAPAPGATLTGSVSLAAQASDNIGVVKVEFLVNGVIVATDTAAPYEFTWNSRDAENGSATIVARAWDAGARSAESVPFSVTIANDKIAPSVALASRAGEPMAKGTVVLSATATDNVGVTKVEWYLDGALAATQTAQPYSYTWKTSGSSDGPHTVTVLAYDAANNIGTTGVVVAVVINRPPAVRIASPVTGWKFKKTQIEGAAPEGVTVLAGNHIVPVAVDASSSAGVAKVEFYVNGKLSATKTSAPYTFDWNTEAENGTRVLTARAYDALGRSTMSGKTSVLVSDDILPPSIKISPKEGKYVTGIATVKVSAKDRSGIGKIELFVDDVPVATGTKSSLAFKWNTAGYSPAESHILKAVVTDKLGNMGEFSSTVKVKDLVPPVLTVEQLAEAGQQVTVAASATDNVGVTRMTVTIDGKVVAGSESGTISCVWDTTAVKAGKHSIVVAAYDAAGKVARQVVAWEKKG